MILECPFYKGITISMSAFSSPLLVLSGGGALVVVVARAVPLAAGRLGAALSTGNKLFLRK